MGSLQDKVVLISGTGRGQGRAAAIAFADEGAIVHGCDVNSDDAADTLRIIQERGGRMSSLHPVDLSDMAGAERWVAAAIDAWGRIDVLYNNAASLRGRSPFGDTTIEEWESCLRYELTIVFTSTRAAWPHFVSAGGGLVINTASMSGHIEPMPITAPIHGVAKAGVLAFTRMLAGEGAQFGIRSVSISPGLVKSPTTERLWTGTPEQQAVGKAIIGKTPMGRAASCDEIANVAVFLASDKAPFINGTDIRIDGGMTGVSYMAR